MKKSLFSLIVSFLFIVAAEAEEWPDVSFSFVDFKGLSSTTLSDGSVVEQCTVNISGDGAVSVEGKTAPTKFQNGSGAADSVRTYSRIKINGADSPSKMQRITLPSFTLEKDGSVTVYAAPTGPPSNDTGRGITISTGSYSATGDWKKTERYTLIGITLSLPAGTYDDVLVVVKGGGMLIFGADLEGKASEEPGEGETLFTYFDSGSLARNSSFITPDWIKSETSTDTVPVIYLKNGLDPKNFKAGFTEALGIASDAKEAYALRIAKTDGYPDRRLILSLDKCEDVTVYFWGTGARGLKLSNNVNANTAFVGVDGHVVGTVTLKVETNNPVKIYLNPSAKTEGSINAGDTYIERIIITQKTSTSSIEVPSTEKGAPISIDYYNTVGQKVNENYNGILIKKSTFADGSIETQKIIIQ